MHKKFTMIT